MPTTDLQTRSRTDSATRTSNSLIGRATNNDPEAWERLVQLYSPLVYFWCKESGLPEPDVHDVFQETFHTLSRKLSLFRPIENGTFRGWLRTLTRNKLADHYRKCNREPRPVGGTEAQKYLEQLSANASESAMGSGAEGASDSPVMSEVELQHTLLSQALSNIKDSFAEQTWKAFWMVVIDGRETSDVAADLSMRPGTVRVAKCRVLKRLRLEIGDLLD